jgi:hypothetical protein
MKTILLLFVLLLLSSSFVVAQSSPYPLVTLHDINYLPDSTTGWHESPLAGDTVRVQGSVIVRPLIDPITDRRTIMYIGQHAFGTAIQSADGSPWSGLVIYQPDTSFTSTKFDFCDTAKTYEFTGIVTPYLGSTELYLITDPTPIPVSLVSQQTQRPEPITLTLDSCFNADGSYTKLRKYNNMYVQIIPDADHPNIITSNLKTGTSAIAGTFNIDNGNGYKLEVYAQSKYFRTNSFFTLRPTYVPPPDGSHLSYVRGLLQAYYNYSSGDYNWDIAPMYPNDLGYFPTDVKSENYDKPTQYNLYQNFPNPFNPTSTVNYSIPKAGIVRITVYNEIGSKVATIVNEYKPAGNYSVQFNGTGISFITSIFI